MIAVIVSRPSHSSRILARELRIRRIRVGERRVPRAATLINWGCSEIPGIYEGTKILNKPSAVRRAVSKEATFISLKGVGVPTVEFTTDPNTAKKWLTTGFTVFGRELTRGSGGEGIHLLLSKDVKKHLANFPELPLYTKFWKCDKELRVHVFRDKVIDYSEKRKVRVDKPHPDRYWIRTHKHGWIYARQDAQLHENVKQVAMKAVHAVGLDFGAVDIRARNNGDCVVLEINSAPGIVGTTLSSYSDVFKRAIHE